MNWNEVKKFHSSISYSPELMCSTCRVKKNRNAGEYVTYNNGKNRKWICTDCLTVARDRAAGNNSPTVNNQGPQ